MSKVTRTIIILLIIVVFVTIAFLTNDKTQHQEQIGTSSKPTLQIEETKIAEIQQKIKDDLDNYKSETLKPIEELYENEDVYKKAKATQGLIEDITVNGAFPMILVGKNIYGVQDTNFTPMLKVEEQTTNLSFYNSMQAGNQLLINTSENLYTSMGENNELFFKDLKLAENEYIYSILNSGFTTITIPQSGNPTVRYYNIREDATVNQDDKINVWNYELNNNKGIKVKKIVPTVANIGTGYYIYCITNNNDLYRATGCMRLSSALSMETTEPLAKDVSNVYAPATIGLYTTCPLYSKIDNNKNVFTKVAGNDVVNNSDDVEIVFNLPENYTTADIKTIFGCGNTLVFEFNDKSIFASEEISQTEAKTYNLLPMMELTLLNQESAITKMCGATSANGYIYVLLTNSKLYYVSL